MKRYMGNTRSSLLATSESRKKGIRKAPFGSHYSNTVFSQETSSVAKLEAVSLMRNRIFTQP